MISFDSLLLGLDATERVMAKAARLDELAQIWQAEAHLRRLMTLRWRAYAKRAAQAGARAVGQGPEAVMSAVDRSMSGFAASVQADVEERIGLIYRLGGQHTAKRTIRGMRSGLVQKSVDISGNLDLVDQAAIRAIRRNVRFWIGNHYGKNISPALRRVVIEEMLRLGGDRTAAAVAMETLLGTKLRNVSIPSGWHGTDRSYFEGLAANIATTARTHAQVNVLRDAQVLRYVIVNPIDERTCQVCSHMDGKIFKVSDGVRVADSFVDAPTPDDARAAHPFVRAASLFDISPKPGNVGPRDSSRLAKARYNLPPFHFRCRCVLDMA